MPRPAAGHLERGGKETEVGGGLCRGPEVPEDEAFIYLVQTKYYVLGTSKHVVYTHLFVCTSSYLNNLYIVLYHFIILTAMLWAL